VRAGKVRSIGTSTFPAHGIVEAQWAAERRALERPACEQAPYSLLVRGIEADVRLVTQRYGMGAIIWSPLCAGWLTGLYRNGRAFPASRRGTRRSTASTRSCRRARSSTRRTSPR
jgi:aryl-alcohol dehydrogenase-like predicted oxidoreductase